MPINVDHYEDLAGEVLKVYEEAERKMMKSVANRLNRGVTQPGWTERKYGEMRDVSRVMRGYVERLSKTRGEMQKAYIEQAFADARAAMISDAQTFANLSEIRGLTANTFKVVNILSELDSSMNAADRMILRKVNDEYAGIVGRASALVATGSITYREAVQRELNDFANRGITSFVDRAGRSWDMETYAEMATLTAIERATREGYLDSMAEFGYDLAEISDHYGACPICEAWQGVIISVSGTTPGYPSLADAESAGVFHPRCMHDISVYYDGISPEGRKGPKEVGDASPGYSVRAQQRGLERHVRAWKRRMAVAGSPQEERAAYARVRMYQERIRELIEDYNDSVDSSVDHLPRKYWREGGRQNLSTAAKKIKPVEIPQSQQPKPKPQPEERKPLTRMEQIKDIIEKHNGDWSVEQLQEVGSKILDEYNARYEKFADEVAKIEKVLKEQQEAIKAQAKNVREMLKNASNSGDKKALRELKKQQVELSEQIDDVLSKRLLYGSRTKDGILLKQILGEVRPLGGVNMTNVTDYAVFAGNSKQTMKSAIEAMNYYPTAWLKGSKAFDVKLKAGWTSGRAFYDTVFGQIKFDGKLDTGIHELMHRFEHSLQQILQSEVEFYAKRTAGEELKWLGSPYAKTEKTRRDDFIDAYMGKDYAGKAFELLSMGTELAFTDTKRLNRDKDMQTWIYGVLASL